MAIFALGKKDTQSSQTKIRPTVVRTQNVAKELISIAKSNDVNIHSIDFNVLDVQTYTRVNKENEEVDWEEATDGELETLLTEKNLLNKYFGIKQMYEIEVFSKLPNDPYQDFHLAIGANATKCKVYLSIKEDSQLSYNKNLEQDLRTLIDKSKVRANILIKVFDSMVENVVSKIAAYVRVQESAKYEKSEMHLVAESYEPILTQNDALILHYEKKQKVGEQEKVNYANRGFIKSVKKGELLIEYIKAKKGKAGRNCRGEFLDPREPLESNTPNFSTDNTIEVINSDSKIEYKAVENGYVVLDGNSYTIKSDIDVDEISFKSTGNISAGLDSDVSISVTESDVMKDAIGTGMKVEVSEIEIEGNVGPNAQVIAVKARVGGQTHKTASVKADDLRINVHKGKAFGKKVYITRLEHGEVDAEVVDIVQSVGGNIRAKEITIQSCGSYVNATASRFIEIKKLQGSENIFTIDPLLKGSVKEGLKQNKEDISKLEKNVKSIKQEIEQYTEVVQKNKASFDDVRRRLVHYKKNNVKMPSSFVKQYNKFKKAKEHLVKIKKEYSSKKDYLALLTTKTASFQDNIFNARIINRDRWVGHNEIIFRLVDPPIEVAFKPAEGSPDKIFAIVESDDGIYKIEAVKE
ncbi:MAG: FapA family protein [Sulfurimonas sp.]|uniref:flagellar assembly protein A n=1 Tax=Sulfurimonas sp. TaxID=2022749 RepID=UPI0025E28081|nr:flagellar assembly protein A [Sulfurimonas sp.]MCK9491222.1 FapA family protein [Sulfurimonas sp.]